MKCMLVWICSWWKKKKIGISYPYITLNPKEKWSWPVFVVPQFIRLVSARKTLKMLLCCVKFRSFRILGIETINPPIKRWPHPLSDDNKVYWMHEWKVLNKSIFTSKFFFLSLTKFNFQPWLFHLINSFLWKRIEIINMSGWYLYWRSLC